MRIGVDFDGTIWPTVEVWAEMTGNQAFSYSGLESYEQVIELAGGADRFLELIQESSTYEAMDPFQAFPQAISVLLELEAEGMDLYLITAREDPHFETVVDILARDGFHPHTAVSKKPDEKVEYCRQNGILLLVEDEPQTIRGAYENGLPVIAMRHGYNSAVIDELGIPHGSNWNELHLRILAHFDP